MNDSNLTQNEASADWISSLTSADILALAQSLRQIDPTWTRGSTGTDQRLWYQGQEFYFDVMLECQGDQITWFQFTLRGRVLSWRRSNNRLQTGETEEMDMPPILSYYAASKKIRPEADLDRDFVMLVQQILSHRQDDPICQAMAAILKELNPA